MTTGTLLIIPIHRHRILSYFLRPSFISLVTYSFQNIAISYLCLFDIQKLDLFGHYFEQSGLFNLYLFQFIICIQKYDKFMCAEFLASYLVVVVYFSRSSLVDSLVLYMYIYMTYIFIYFFHLQKILYCSLTVSTISNTQEKNCFHLIIGIQIFSNFNYVK